MFYWRNEEENLVRNLKYVVVFSECLSLRLGLFLGVIEATQNISRNHRSTFVLSRMSHNHQLWMTIQSKSLQQSIEQKLHSFYASTYSIKFPKLSFHISRHKVKVAPKKVLIYFFFHQTTVFHLCCANKYWLCIVQPNSKSQRTNKSFGKCCK